jgi:uncharacterized membrane protein
MAENIVRLLIYVHAALGGIALLSGSVALATPKGNRLHKKTGIIFYYTMLSAALLALFISVQPNHVSYFLFVIGIFSAYMILSGKRILKLKLMYKGMKPSQSHYVLPVTMLVVGIAMIAFGLYLKSSGDNNGIVMMVFGGIGSVMSVGDIRMLRSTPTDRLFWLYQHISKMTGGYIAAFTAFLVVNEVLPGLWGWLSPTVAGTLYIIYHQVRFRKKGQKILAERKVEY